jgi:hypothetical protein
MLPAFWRSQVTTSAAAACASPCSTSGSAHTAERSCRRPAVSHTRMHAPTALTLVGAGQRTAGAKLSRTACQHTSTRTRNPLPSQMQLHAHILGQLIKLHCTALGLPVLTCACTPTSLRAHAGWQPKINTALWNTIQLLFPQHAAEAPPPTPPGAPQPAAAAAGSSRRQAASLSAGSRGPADGLQDWMNWPTETSRLMRATRASMHRMADAVAGFRADVDAAARQPFRPPR